MLLRSVSNQSLSVLQVCVHGDHQSPVNLRADTESLTELPEALVTRFNFPLIKDPTIANNGHNLQVRGKLS